jgi:hypothetical protein
MEDELQKSLKMEDDLQQKLKHGRQPQQKTTLKKRGKIGAIYTKVFRIS